MVSVTLTCNIFMPHNTNSALTVRIRVSSSIVSKMKNTDKAYINLINFLC